MGQHFWAIEALSALAHDTRPQAFRLLVQLIGMDNMVGWIAAGKKADFAVLDHDPFRVGVTGLHSIRAECKIFDGKFAAS